MKPISEDTPCVVIDTNVVLDLWLFFDPSVQGLRDQLEHSVLSACQSPSVVWLATEAMREELHRVLHYTHIQRRYAIIRPGYVEAVMQSFDLHSRLCPPAPRAAVSCSDPDDQIFIDLAVQYHACLLSKDHAILSLRKRLAAQSVRVVDQLIN